MGERYLQVLDESMEGHSVVLSLAQRQNTTTTRFDDDGVVDDNSKNYDAEDQEKSMELTQLVASNHSCLDQDSQHELTLEEDFQRRRERRCDPLEMGTPSPATKSSTSSKLRHPSSSSLNDVSVSSSSSSSLALARRLLYVSHSMAQFSEVAWQFCLILFLAAFSHYQSLVLVSTYGLVNGLVVCLLGGLAGQHVDASHRLVVVQQFIWTENMCVIFATICCYLLLGRQLQQQEQQQHHHNDTTAVPSQLQPHEETSSSFVSGFQSIPHDAISLVLLVLIHILGAVASVLDLGFTVAMERDWIVVMSRHPAAAAAVSSLANDQEQLNEEEERAKDDDNNEYQASSSVASNSSNNKWLSETNVAMRQIDLACKIIAPAMAGFFVSWWNHGSSTINNTNSVEPFAASNSTSPSSSSSSPSQASADLRGAAILVGALNVAALVMEYICTKQIYHLIPDLAYKQEEEDKREMNLETELVTHAHDDDDEFGDKTAHLSTISNSGSSCWNRLGLPCGLGIYLEQSTALGGIGLAMLYLNVLSFGGIMTAYLVWRGMRLETVGIWRGISCIVGLLGTFAYHLSVKYIRLETTALWSIMAQFACLSLSYASLWVDDDNYHTVSLTMLIGGVCASRVGLWVFDIAITQMMQLHVADNVRGVVGGVQQSLNAFFDLLAFGIGLFLSDPREFHVYVAVGYASVGIAMLLYGFDFVRKQMAVVPTASYRPVELTSEGEA